ncbi:hypothetical protein C0Q70_01418 [Pomacea canaliculata]|uniref:Uncharacterized protein n=1 Tax=Pomacea canaliculata TaxID=400727 RepID=A0A2T7PZE3_POMCA|nr:hypothetical protein C0Q70_01418 [Pomacea canaliculata]
MKVVCRSLGARDEVKVMPGYPLSPGTQQHHLSSWLHQQIKAEMKEKDFRGIEETASSKAISSVAEGRL